MTHQRYRFGPSNAPQLIKVLVGVTIALHLLGIILRPHFPTFFTLTNPIAYISLSTWGINHLFLWQLLTWPFVPPIAYSFSLSFVLYLVFTMYLLWTIGTSIYELKGKKDFLKLLVGSTLFIGLVVLGLLYLFGSNYPISGVVPIMYALLAAWLILYPDLQLLLFLFFPVKAKWLVLVVAAFDLISDLTNGAFIQSSSTIAALIFGYLFGILTWKRPGPFHALHKMDWTLIHWKDSLSIKKDGDSGKIYDIRSGKSIERDEAFMDRCLSKISKEGKQSLTLMERWRMHRISKRKRKR